MTSFIFVPALGKVAYYASLPGSDDFLVAVPFKKAGLPSDTAMSEYATLADIKSSTATEHTTLGRVQMSNVSVADYVDGSYGGSVVGKSIKADDLIWQSASGDPVGCLVICYSPDASSSDANLIPLAKLDADITLTGDGISYQFGANGFCVLYKNVPQGGGDTPPATGDAQPGYVTSSTYPIPDPLPVMTGNQKSEPTSLQLGDYAWWKFVSPVTGPVVVDILLSEGVNDTWIGYPTIYVVDTPYQYPNGISGVKASSNAAQASTGISPGTWASFDAVEGKTYIIYWGFSAGPAVAYPVNLVMRVTTGIEEPVLEDPPPIGETTIDVIGTSTDGSPITVTSDALTAYFGVDYNVGISDMYLLIASAPGAPTPIVNGDDNSFAYFQTESNLALWSIGAPKWNDTTPFDITIDWGGASPGEAMLVLIVSLGGDGTGTWDVEEPTELDTNVSNDGRWDIWKSENSGDVNYTYWFMSLDDQGQIGPTGATPMAKTPSGKLAVYAETNLDGSEITAPESLTASVVPSTGAWVAVARPRITPDGYVFTDFWTPSETGGGDDSGDGDGTSPFGSILGYMNSSGAFSDAEFPDTPLVTPAYGAGMSSGEIFLTYDVNGATDLTAHQVPVYAYAAAPTPDNGSTYGPGISVSGSAHLADAGTLVVNAYRDGIAPSALGSTLPQSAQGDYDFTPMGSGMTQNEDGTWSLLGFYIDYTNSSDQSDEDWVGATTIASMTFTAG